jgi:hypothetical protein
MLLDFPNSCLLLLILYFFFLGFICLTFRLLSYVFTIEFRTRGVSQKSYI